MPELFQYDAFLNHNAKDKAVVHLLTERLRADWIRVWLWIEMGDCIPSNVGGESRKR